MSKHEIDIPELPEGWKPVAYRPRKNLSERYLSNDSNPVVMYDSSELATASVLIVEKIQPRRIVLEETDETRIVVSGEWCNIEGQLQTWDSRSPSCNKYRVWREVKETDLSLTKDDDKLSLRVDECKEIVRLMDQGLVKKNLSRKIREFIKDK